MVIWQLRRRRNMSDFGYLLLLTSDAPSGSELGQPAQAIAAAIAESGIQIDSIITGSDARESAVVNRALEELGKLPREIIADDRLRDSLSVSEFYEDRVVPMLLQRQSVVIIARSWVTSRLREYMDPQFVDTERQEPTLYRFDKDLNAIRNHR
ncbi:MAG: hypothetical protein CMH36_06360 [Microbacterium sp.]|uniref:Uncharacterized protein n=2 Tax=Microbacterium ginsengisoli TaxID=400772 RepID=A0A3C1KG51_9MICO|nr:hypothetical protein [Microbacterium sp.]HAN25216.1 hypothetical protein [Microbacterium ginsengisoli]